ncbi:MAG: type II toxin-antitoxin system Phd/YefM family antitoxin [Myxococcales bacterium]|nr:type II toxin-antitoxin system Phd/YefM family antitoxin [Myxococcales bacterium]
MVAKRGRKSRESESEVYVRRSAGEVTASRVTASEAKNEFGRVLDEALRTGAVVITRHEAPKAVLLSMEEYRELVAGRTRQLDALTAEFDAMFERMQAPGFNEGMKAAFGASPQELGRAAVTAAKKHG